MVLDRRAHSGLVPFCESKGVPVGFSCKMCARRSSQNGTSSSGSSALSSDAVVAVERLPQPITTCIVQRVDAAAASGPPRGGSVRTRPPLQHRGRHRARTEAERQGETECE